MTGNKGFVHLHLHTQYSLLDGAIRLDDLFAKCKEFGMDSVAITDHGNMFGAVDFYTKARANGIKPIIGAEIYITAGSRFEKKAPKFGEVLDSQDETESRHHIHHLVLLAKNETGYQNLSRIVSMAYLEGFYYKPRADYEILEKYSEGLICTTACLKGEVGYHLYTNQDAKALAAVKKLHAIFKDDLYLEIQENGLPEQKIVNEKLLVISKDTGIPLVATNDCHYLLQEDSAAHEVLLCIQTQKNFSDEKRMKLKTNEFYFKSPEIMRSAFSYCPEACDNTLAIAAKCNLELKWTDEKGRQIYHFPKFEISTGETVDDFFMREAREGLEKRFNGPHFRKLLEKEDWETKIKPQYCERLNYEMKMIGDMGFIGYYLIVFDFIKWARKNAIPVGPGRGSGAGSLAAYALGITNIDPIRYNLLFERFINPERVSLPDFDVDFCQSGRERVIAYVTQKYGADRVGQIITFGKMLAKAVIRDVARVYDLPYAEADFLAKLVPDELGITLEDAIEKEPKLRELEEKDPKIRQILKIARKLEGLLRHASIHAAGVIITNKPLIEHCPLFRGKEGEVVVQFDKDFSEKIGLIKYDFLGLKTLTMIDNATRFIRRDHDAAFDIENIDLDDRSVFEFISKGRTVGVFQLESSGMIDLCRRIRPDSIDDITAINALFRPGPLESGMVDDFVEIKHGRKEMEFMFPELENVLKDTYGVIVYQEQVMNIARVIAGYSLGQADILRRAMGKKKASVMAENKKLFIEGAQKKRYNPLKAEALFDLMANFAAYGFNKSHAVAYAYIAYQTAWLKKYYPPSFYAALLSTEMSNTDKITQYINDARESGIKVLPPDINESLWSFNVVGDAIRFGMGAVKNVGEGAVEEIITQREKNGPYTGLVEFCERVDMRKINRRVLECLVKVGAFDLCEKWGRRTMLENLDTILAYASKYHEEQDSGQVNLFDLEGMSSTSSREQIVINEVEEFESEEKLKIEAELMGIYVSGHPLDKYKAMIKQLSSCEIARIADLQGTDKRSMTLAGLVTISKELFTKKGDRMAVGHIEDLSGKIQCVLFPKTYAEYSDFLKETRPLVIKGQVNLAETPRKFFPEKIDLIKDAADEKVLAVRVTISTEKFTVKTVNDIKNAILDFRGAVPVHFIFKNDDLRARLPLGDDFLVNPSPQLAARINDILRAEAVTFILASEAKGS
jgi:DNA polymerase-3 subunit alpha